VRINAGCVLDAKDPRRPFTVTPLSAGAPHPSHHPFDIFFSFFAVSLLLLLAIYLIAIIIVVARYFYILAAILLEFLCSGVDGAYYIVADSAPAPRELYIAILLSFDVASQSYSYCLQGHTYFLEYTRTERDRLDCCCCRRRAMLAGGPYIGTATNGSSSSGRDNSDRERESECS
jgi:hypothetical protein